MARYAPGMSRPFLDPSALHPAIRDQVAQAHADLLKQAIDAVAAHPVVVFGMAGNPFVRQARKALDAAGIAHHDIDHGGYLSQWRARNALKMWTGWPTFPMIFVKGVLVGGAGDLRALLDNGELRRMLG